MKTFGSASLGALVLGAGLIGLTYAAGRTMLPTEWSIAPPPDVVVPTGTLPESARLTADNAHLIVVEGGARPPAIRILDPTTLATQQLIALKNLYGEPALDAQGAGFWVGTGAENKLVHYDAATGMSDRSIDLPRGFWPGALALSPDGKTLAVSGDLVGVVVLVDVDSAKRAEIKVGKHPAGLAFSPDGKMLYAADWDERSVSIVDVTAAAPLDPIDVGLHPEKLLLSRDGTKLYVSETDDDAIGIIDLKTAKRIADVNIGLYDAKLYGASPTSMALSANGRRLYVACSAANAIVVIELAPDGASGRILGAIPTGWYPTAVTLDPSGRALLVANGKGEGSPADPNLDPKVGSRDPQYVSKATIGSVRRIPLPDDAALTAGIESVRALGGPALGSAISSAQVRLYGPSGDDAGRAIVRKGGPIRHVIYIIKENRSYDQVLGDLPGGDGDPKLTMFGPDVTPNQHAIATRFGLFDATYADSFVSPDGHNWSTAAFANDYVEKMVPPEVGYRGRAYDFEDPLSPARPRSGYIWDNALRHHASIRNYGEFVYNDPSATFKSHWRQSDLLAITDASYPGWNLDLSDLVRESEWAREFAAFVKNGNLPALEVIRLPNDHTSYTSPKKLTPRAMVAQNDLAFGRIVEAVSHSKYWASTAIFAIEDDAQNGPDHVDDQRTTFYVASPYARSGVHHLHYSSAGALRTIELILGLPPMTAYDAAARPMYAAFGRKPDMHAFNALPARIDLEERNSATSYRARDSAKLDLRQEDEVPAAVGNDILWHAIRGSAATPPPFGAFER